MFRKRLAVWGCLLCLVTFFAGAVAFADDLADVQKKIKDKDFKWIAERHRQPREERTRPPQRWVPEFRPSGCQ